MKKEMETDDSGFDGVSDNSRIGRERGSRMSC